MLKISRNAGSVYLSLGRVRCTFYLAKPKPVTRVVKIIPSAPPTQDWPWFEDDLTAIAPFGSVER